MILRISFFWIILFSQLVSCETRVSNNEYDVNTAFLKAVDSIYREVSPINLRFDKFSELDSLVTVYSDSLEKVISTNQSLLDFLFDPCFEKHFPYEGRTFDNYYRNIKSKIIKKVDTKTLTLVLNKYQNRLNDTCNMKYMDHLDFHYTDSLESVDVGKSWRYFIDKELMSRED